MSHNNGRAESTSVTYQVMDDAICEPLISEAFEWLGEPDVWKGVLPANLEECEQAIRFHIGEAVYMAFEAGVKEGQKRISLVKSRNS